MNEPTNLLYYLKKSTAFLEKKNIPNPRVDAEWILSDILKLPRIKLYSQFEMPLTEKEVTLYRERIMERGKGKPVAYITGKKGFHKFDYAVTQETLIPRPETEELVDKIFKRFGDLTKGEQTPNVLDLGTGSGCIAISLSRLLSLGRFWASDISPGALEVAKQNHREIENPSQIEILFFESDLFQKFPEDLLFHLIVSNPPYIPIFEKEEMMPDVVDFEPHLALFVEDFIAFHAKIIEGSFIRLVAGGILALETHPNFAKELVTLGMELGFKEVWIEKDLSEKDRFVFFKKDL